MVACTELSDYDSDFMLQLISKARELADITDMKVSFACLGEELKDKFGRLSRYGTDIIYFTEYKGQSDDITVSGIIGNIIKEKKPKVVLFPATNTGKAAAAILSTRFEAGLTADVISLDYEGGTFSFSRAAINDSLVAKIQCINCDIMICTVKENAFAVSECSNKYDAEIILLDMPVIETERNAKKEIEQAPAEEAK